MDEKLFEFLESSSTRWNNVYRTSVKPIPIRIFVDCQNGIWNLGKNTGPCGGALEYGSNPYRQFWYCPLHENEGILINLYWDNSWIWISGKEDKK